MSKLKVYNTNIFVQSFDSHDVQVVKQIAMIPEAALLLCSSPELMSP